MKVRCLPRSLLKRYLFCCYAGPATASGAAAEGRHTWAVNGGDLPPANRTTNTPEDINVTLYPVPACSCVLECCEAAMRYTTRAELASCQLPGGKFDFQITSQATYDHYWLRTTGHTHRLRTLFNGDNSRVRMLLCVQSEGRFTAGVAAPESLG